MENNQNPAQNAFMGLSGEQMAKIVYEEFSKSGFQLNNFNAMMPSIIGRVLMGNSGTAGNNLSQMFLKGMMGNGGMAGNNLSQMFLKGMMGNGGMAGNNLSQMFLNGIMGNGGTTGSNLTQMLMRGIMGGFFKR